MSRLALLLALALPGVASAQIDPRCQGLEKPEDYDERTQQDFLANYVALATTYSPTHAPIPHEPGHGSIGVQLAGIPPLGCGRRYVLEWTKTEETNKTPVAPRPRVSFAFPAVGRFVPYASVAYFPPIPLLGTRNVILSGEIGVGAKLGEKLQLGGRFHATSQKTVADIATSFEPDGPVVDDLFLASTFGLDLIGGYALKGVTPYVSAGFVDVSTFFFIGDDNVVTNNYHPYFGPALSLGADGLVKRFRWGAELYTAPGGHSKPDPEIRSEPGFGRYGAIVTGRVHVGIEL